MAFSSVVLIKQTPDLNAIRVDKSSGKALLGDQLVMSSADAIAVEAALQLREAHGGEVTVVTAGPASARDVLQRALAMGADRGIHVTQDVSRVDTLATARVLADAVKSLTIDLLLMTFLHPALAMMSRIICVASSPVLAKWTCPPRFSTLAASCSR